MDFNQAINFVLKHEGGYIDDPLDPGGETKYGISKRAYPDLDIKNLSIGHATFLYEKDYWIPMKCPALSDLLRLPVFDMAVNQGIRGATICLQKSLGIVTDGVFGNQTLVTCQTLDQEKLYSDFMRNRVKKYFNTPGFDRYGQGWINRVMDLAIYNSKENAPWKTSYRN